MKVKISIDDLFQQQAGSYKLTTYLSEINTFSIAKFRRINTEFNNKLTIEIKKFKTYDVDYITEA